MVITFVPVVVLAYVLYFMFYFRGNHDLKEILPLYLLGIGYQLLHFAEEHASGFERYSPLFSTASLMSIIFLTFNMAAYFLFLAGDYDIYKGIKPLMMLAMFFIAHGMLSNCIGHIGFAIAAKGTFQDYILPS